MKILTAIAMFLMTHTLRIIDLAVEKPKTIVSGALALFAGVSPVALAQEGVFNVGQTIVTVGTALPDTINATAVFEALGVGGTLVLALAMGVKVVKYLIALIV